MKAFQVLAAVCGSFLGLEGVVKLCTPVPRKASL